jgi:NMD protein affecting ribosome stability and mRNA decay
MNKGLSGRKDRLIQEKRHDTYQEGHKWPESTRCTQCGALFVKGRWTWQESAEAVGEAICPACRRIAEHYPAGYIEISGPFFAEHREEILNLIRNVEKQEKDEHPLERIMAITTEKEPTLVTTTGLHLARRIGQALARAYTGNLSFRYADNESSIRVYWQR